MENSCKIEILTPWGRENAKPALNQMGFLMHNRFYGAQYGIKNH